MVEVLVETIGVLVGLVVAVLGVAREDRQESDGEMSNRENGDVTRDTSDEREEFARICFSIRKADEDQ